jgi:SsrA-binding protein
MSDLSVNKRALFDYDIVEKFTAGIKLTGHETKSAKLGRMDIAGCHAIARRNGLYLTGVTIHSFQPKNAPAGYDPTRTRTLLLTRKEIRHLAEQLNAGLTLVPLKAYTHHGFVKLELGLGRGRKKRDKREVVKKREVERDIRRATRN